MNLYRIAWSNLWNKPLSTLLTLLLFSFGVGIISLLLLIEVQLREQFERNIKDIDMVLGAKGSPLQLILANVYHVDAPTGNIKLAEAQKVLKNRFLKLYIQEAIPLAYGDYYLNYRIVGTDSSYAHHYRMKLHEGRLFSAPFEATIGSKVAVSAGLKVGDTFISSHGLDRRQEGHMEGDHIHDDKPYTVVGIFEQSGSVIDQLILTPVESIWLVHEHHEHEEGETDEEHEHEAPEREVTAFLIKERTTNQKTGSEHKASQLQMMLPNLVKETNMQAAQPAIEINRLSEGFGLGLSSARIIAILIMFISFISVFVSLYNSLKDRKYELALLRTMGGTRGTLFKLITLEGLWLTLMGYLCGIVLGRAALFALSQVLEDKFNYSVSRLQPLVGEWILLAVTLAVGILASLLPAIRALRIDISKTLSNG